MAGSILYKEECYQIQGAVFEVYREMGCGFLEAVYQEPVRFNVAIAETTEITR
ncbi:MAG: GxxExxY protein [Desulfuromonadaceae bacterium]|nr:GxxExxY protein [Desulfuromonadaceae bacterium]